MRGIIFGNIKAKAIRTYNFKRGTVEDHRSGMKLPLKPVLDGDLEALIDSARVHVTRMKESNNRQ